MSLKAKLEAVIYAAEEPVTLAQLAAIFADEVLPGLDEEAEPVAEQILLAGITPESDAPESVVTETANVDSPVEGAVAVGEAPATVEVAEVIDEKKIARQRDRRARQLLQGILDELMAEYTKNERGMEIREIAGGYRMATKPEYHDVVRGFVKSLKPPMKLSLQALETLAVIAYKQPVTAPEVSEIRGVDSGGVLGSLVGRKLVTTAGRKPVIGRPILYKTTKEFLLRFGLKDVNDLPSMEEFEKMAGELVEPEVGDQRQEEVTSSGDLESTQEISAELEPNQLAETQAPEPQTEEPQALEQHPVEMQTAEPETTEVQMAETHTTAEPQTEEPQAVEQHPVEQHPVEMQTAEPETTEVRMAETHTTEKSQAVEPQTEPER
jgi:segregation and condensation protein B